MFGLVPPTLDSNTRSASCDLLLYPNLVNLQVQVLHI